MKNDIESCLLQQLNLLSSVVATLSDSQYTTSAAYLSEATFGQHCRHAIELLQCLQQGYERGVINYDDRKRDTTLEQNRLACMHAIQALQIALQCPDKPLLLHTSAIAAQAEIEVQTTFYRELLYNTEHLIHHMALMRVALKEFGFNNIPADFGYAYATLQYQQQCAQ